MNVFADNLSHICDLGVVYNYGCVETFILECMKRFCTPPLRIHEKRPPPPLIGGCAMLLTGLFEVE